MKWKIFSVVLVGVLIPSVAANIYTNQSWEFVDKVFDECSKVVNVHFGPEWDIAQNMMGFYKIYSNRMKNLANETTTTLPYAYPKLLKVLSLLVTLTDSPRNMLVQFKLVLETIFAALRQIVFSLERIIGKPVVDTIIDNIKCIERALKRLLEEYLNNDVSNLSHGKKADFEPVMKCLQKLTNTLALIGNAILENPSLATVEALESMTVLCLVLAQCLTYIQGTISTIAIIIHSKTNRIPQSSDSLIVGLGEAIDSLVNITLSTCLNLLKNLGNVSAKLNATLKSLLGIATGLPMGLNKVTECLSCGFSSVAGGLNYFFG